ncbi:hypothetical protein FEK35_10975 [Nocardia cyriacigeorgica]|uniref:Uncharacterized protein n=1 Tax=Nocardia cyriacigeorgica TaxID=135487 RepID=A0A5R8PF74_9NOCA|nr:hypothetical protein [Nocardia cyriacigeorgica]TLG12430.1 hypothetical protein FEK35_10975 [Nocardia cyriacigeorgica]
MKWLSMAVVAGVAVVIGFLFLVVASFAGVSSSSGERFFNCQCDSAIGPDPSVTTTSTPNSTVCDSEGEWDPSDVPTTNPYASMTVAPDDTEISDWHRDCLSAMTSAPLQTPASRTTNTGFAVECARELALARVGARADGATSAPAEMTREVIYEASAALSTARCVLPSGGDVSGSEGAASPTEQSRYTLPTGSCAQTADQIVVDLPNTIAGQGRCGQRVQLDAVSPGDLIFWDYRDHAPTRVGIAVNWTCAAADPATAQCTAAVQPRVVTADPASGRFAVLEIPGDGDARAKRVLAGVAN